ncbi:cation diffusion facilitator family transporter [Falsibacillus pallidus]|uniref:cation diffusion facilitator family transporter n=1 Tax=Falsibacillus pallidus TaxID=493781 RepID=UPI003D96264A
MSHHHHHDHGFDAAREGNRKGLLAAFIITLLFMIAEFIGGLISNSLALLSDSGHMLSDTASLGLSLLAIWFASRPPSPNKTYGYYRFEILAALFNAITLFVITAFIFYEAYKRFVHPPEVSSGTMLIIAILGLLSNLLSAWFLMKKGDVKENLNLKSAYLHVLGDTLGSIGAIGASLLIMFFKWYIADPIISVIVGLLILKSAWGILQNSVHILMEGTPDHCNEEEMTERLKEVDGVLEVHDIHIWTITSGMDLFTCHVQIEEDRNEQDLLQKLIGLLKVEYKIEHSTIQIEKSMLSHPELKV